VEILHGGAGEKRIPNGKPLTVGMQSVRFEIKKLEGSDGVTLALPG
jgi:hypothetical protein